MTADQATRIWQHIDDENTALEVALHAAEQSTPVERRRVWKALRNSRGGPQEPSFAGPRRRDVKRPLQSTFRNQRERPSTEPPKRKRLILRK